MRVTYEDGKELKVKFMSFSGGERHVQIQDLPDEIKGPINVGANLRSSDDIMDLLLLNDALLNEDGERLGSGMNLTIPYMPYSRQDRVCAPGQAFSLAVFTELLTMLTITELTTWDIHSGDGCGLLGVDVNISQEEIISHSPELEGVIKSKNTVLICPDKGAVYRCQKLAKKYNAVDRLVYCDKKRNPETGEITETVVKADDLTGKTCVITDDICDGGYTFIKIAERLKELGASSVVLYVTHGIFSKGTTVFDGLIDRIFTTNSFPQFDGRVVSVINYGEQL